MVESRALTAETIGSIPTAASTLPDPHTPAEAAHQPRISVTTRGRVIRLPRITRAMVRADRGTMFVFGDNMEGRGFGGQAKEMRGEPNTIGVPTKWAPERRAPAYFSDADRLNRDVWHAIREAFNRMRSALDDGQNVVIPAGGLGTGLAELPTRAPRLHAMIEAAIADLESNDAH